MASGVFDNSQNLKKLRKGKKTSICYNKAMAMPHHLQFLSDIKPKSKNAVAQKPEKPVEIYTFPTL